MSRSNILSCVSSMNESINHKSYKHVYYSIKFDYLQLCKKPILQKGGYITMEDALIDSILRMFNIKLYKNITSTVTDNVSAYDDLAKFIFPSDKYQKYVKNKSDYKRAYATLNMHKKTMTDMYGKSPLIFDEIYNHLDSTHIVSSARKKEIMRELASIFGATFWKKISDIDRDTLVKSIFVFYQNDLTLVESDTLMIVDPKNYILYRNGNVDQPSITKYFEFDSENFVTTKIDDINRINKLIGYNKRGFIVSIKKIYTSDISLYDISTVYSYMTEAIRNLNMLNNVSDEEKLLIKIPNLLPNTVKFLETLFNIRRGEFTNRNSVIYSMIFTDNLHMLLSLISNVLADRFDINTSANNVTIEELLPTINPSLVNDLDKTIYDPLLSMSKKLTVDKKLFTLVNENEMLGSLIRAFNYFNLVTLANKIDMDTVKRDPLNMIYTFLSELKIFLVLIRKFKDELLSFIQKIEPNVYKKPNDLVKIFVLVYIIHIVREKSNIHISKVRTIDSLVNVQRDMDKISDKLYTQHIAITKWIEGNSLTTVNRPTYKRVREYSTKVGKDVFNSCGESMTLNFMNYILLDPITGLFKIPHTTSNKLREYYSTRRTISDVMNMEKNSVTEWAVLISNINNIEYNRYNCELIPSATNVLKLFTTLIPGLSNVSSAGMAGLKEFVKSIDPTIKVQIARDKIFDILVINDYCVKFNRGHGMMDVYIDPENPENPENLHNEISDRYIRESIIGCQTVLLSLVQAPTNIIDRLIYLDRLDILQTQDVMNVINTKTDHFKYALTNALFKTINTIMFNDFSDSALMSVLIEHIVVNPSDENLKIFFNDVLEKSKNNKAYIGAIYRYIQDNITKSDTDPIVSKLIDFIKTVDPSIYVDTILANPAPIKTAIMLNESNTFIKQLISNPKSHIELSNEQQYDNLMSSVIQNDNKELFDDMISTPYLTIPRIHHIASITPIGLKLQDNNSNYDYVEKALDQYLSLYLSETEMGTAILSLIESINNTDKDSSIYKNIKTYIKSLSDDRYSTILPISSDPLLTSIKMDRSNVLELFNDPNIVNEITNRNSVEQILSFLINTHNKNTQPIISKLISTNSIDSAMIMKYVPIVKTQSIINLLLNSIKDKDNKTISELMVSQVLYDHPNKVSYSNNSYSISKNKYVVTYFSHRDKKYVDDLLNNTVYRSRPIYSYLLLERYTDLTDMLNKFGSESAFNEMFDELKTKKSLIQIIMLACASSYKTLFEYLMKTTLVSIDLFVSFFKDNIYRFASTTITESLDPSMFNFDYIKSIYIMYNEITDNNYKNRNNIRYDDIVQFVSKLDPHIMIGLVTNLEQKSIIKCLRLDRPDVLIELLNTNYTIDFETKDEFDEFADALTDILIKHKNTSVLIDLIRSISKNINITSIIEHYTTHIDEKTSTLTSTSSISSTSKQIINKTDWSNALIILLNIVNDDLYYYYDSIIDLLKIISDHTIHFTNRIFNDNNSFSTEGKLRSKEYHTHAFNMFNYLFAIANKITTDDMFNEDINNVKDVTKDYIAEVHRTVIQRLAQYCRNNNKFTNEHIDLSIMILLSADKVYKYYAGSDYGIELLIGIPEAYNFILTCRYDYMENKYTINPPETEVHIIKHIVNRFDISNEALGTLPLTKIEELGISLTVITNSDERIFSEHSWEVLENVRKSIKKDINSVINSMCHQVLIRFGDADDSFSYDTLVFDDNDKFIFQEYDDYDVNQYENHYDNHNDENIYDNDTGLNDDFVLGNDDTDSDYDVSDY